jgi:predicted transcriptional regulator
MEKTLPITSLEAFDQMTEPLISNHHQQISFALKHLKKGTFEEIATFLNWDDKNRAARRLSELERNQIVYKTGEKRKTKYGRNAFVYCLTNG